MIEIPEEPLFRLKVEVCRKPEYTIRFSQPDAHLIFGHVDLHVPWTPTVKRQLLADWESLKALSSAPIYGLHDPDDHKHKKFLQIIGMQPVTTYVDRVLQKELMVYST